MRELGLEVVLASSLSKRCVGEDYRNYYVISEGFSKKEKYCFMKALSSEFLPVQHMITLLTRPIDILKRLKTIS